MLMAGDTVSGPPDAAVTRVSAEIETPGPMRPVAGPSVTVGQEMAWGPASADGSRTARLILKVAGMPVEVDAHARLAPTASGCAVEYSGTLAVKVPILGPALEAVPYGVKPEVVLSTSRGSFSYVFAEAMPDDVPGHWRAQFDLTVGGGEPVEMRCYLKAGDTVLTETWLYQYLPF